MIHRDINTLKDLGPEIVYPDAMTGERVNAVVGRVEYVNDKLAFVYTISPYDDENVHVEDGFRYRDIIVFDDRPDTEHGWHKNPIEALAKNHLNR